MSDSDGIISQLEAFVLEAPEDDTSDSNPPNRYIFFSLALPLNPSAVITNLS
jgi:hypothetical protein